MTATAIVPLGIRRSSIERAQRTSLDKVRYSVDILRRSVDMLRPSQASRRVSAEGTMGAADDWALATGHESGRVILWDPHPDASITPVIQLHPGTGPCRYGLK